MIRKFLVAILVLISLGTLALRFSDQLAEVLLGIKKESGISILSQPSEATVFLDNKEVGKTPFEDKNLNASELNVRLEKDGASWQGKVKLAPGTVTVVNRDLAKDPTSSAGEILTLDKGKGLTIISNPSGASVEVDGKEYGKTPVTFDIGSGDHTIAISNPNYLQRSIRANLPTGFNLTIVVDLALSEADLSTITTPVTTQTPEVLVTQTPTGFLRLRDKPNLNGTEIAQVKPGEALVLLEEVGAWDRVRLQNGTEGYVSSAYVVKKNP